MVDCLVPWIMLLITNITRNTLAAYLNLSRSMSMTYSRMFSRFRVFSL